MDIRQYLSIHGIVLVNFLYLPNLLLTDTIRQVQTASVPFYLELINTQAKQPNILNDDISRDKKKGILWPMFKKTKKKAKSEQGCFL